MNQRTSDPGLRPVHVAAGLEQVTRSLASAVVSAMAPERRAVLALAIAQQCSYRDIARQLAIPEDTVKAHMREALTTVYQDVVAQPAVLEPRTSPTPLT